MDDQQFRQLLDRFGYSWKGYRKVRKGVQKRIGKHMQQLGCRSIDEYFNCLDGDEEARKHYECLMTVSVSRFFRDSFLWKVLELWILPTVIEENRKKVRLWFAGCACGEEVYSFKMVWESLRDRVEPMPELEILATDCCPVYLQRARDRICPSSSLREVPQALRETYFILQVEDGLYRISSSLEKRVLWKVHNLLFELGESDFQIIFLRNNILTYYKDGLKQSAFLKVLTCLARGGFLIIGSHEKLPVEPKELVGVSGSPYIFKRIR
jgi:chemotaxis protein methyltransferase CheR